jgi:hypothetical protein
MFLCYKNTKHGTKVTKSYWSRVRVAKPKEIFSIFQRGKERKKDRIRHKDKEWKKAGTQRKRLRQIQRKRTSWTRAKLEILLVLIDQSTEAKYRTFQVSIS